jgi:AcrR family transcriptional regulator
MTADPAAIAERLLAGRAAGVRADARRNLVRLVQAAGEALDEVGVRASSHDIARRAGVGVGTFYRQVASLDELLTVIISRSLEELVAAADAALLDPDPWHGFTELAGTWARMCATSRGVHEAVQGHGELDLTPMLVRLRLRLHRLVRHTQRAGVLRADATWRDVASLLHGVRPADTMLGEPGQPDQWQRNLTVVLAGLKGS